MSAKHCILLSWILILWACKNTAPPPPPDPLVLLRTGIYDEAVIEANKQLDENPENIERLIMLGTSQAAQASPQGSIDKAMNTLRRANQLSSPGQVIYSFASNVVGSMAFEGIRFGTCSQLVLALGNGWQPTAGDKDATLGASAILFMSAYGIEHRAPVQHVEPLVLFAINLLENATSDLIFQENDLHNAWISFQSAGNLSAVTNSTENGNLSHVSAELAIRIIESNPSLAIAALCDLSSPRDKLRETLRLRHDTDSLNRLSRAMESAEGCNIGMYAP